MHYNFIDIYVTISEKTRPVSFFLKIELEYASESPLKWLSNDLLCVRNATCGSRRRAIKKDLSVRIEFEKHVILSET